VPRIRELLGERSVSVPDGPEIQWSPGVITVAFRNDRRQRIRYELKGVRYHFTSRVAPPRAVKKLGLGRVAKELLLRNRVTEVVTFGLGPRHGVDAWIIQRAATMQREELLYYVVLLAREADRLEFLFTGRDRY
jgi:hypothetical protein